MIAALLCGDPVLLVLPLYHDHDRSEPVWSPHVSTPCAPTLDSMALSDCRNSIAIYQRSKFIIFVTVTVVLANLIVWVRRTYLPHVPNRPVLILLGISGVAKVILPASAL